MMPNRQATSVTPSTTLRRLVAPSIRPPIISNLQSPRRSAHQGDANLLAVGDVGVADGDQAHWTGKAGHPHACGGLLDDGHGREGDLVSSHSIPHPLAAGG